MTTTHKLIAKTAKEMAAAFYEIRARRDNEWFARFRSQRKFIAQEWPMFLPAARDALVTILGDPNTHENVKQPIYHALQHERGIENGLLIREDALH